MSEIENRLLEWADKAEALMSELSGPAIDTALMAVRVEAANHLSLAVVMFALAYVCYRVFVFCAGERKDLSKSSAEDYDYGTGQWVAVGLGVLFFFIAFVNVANLWTWTALFYPHLYIAHQVLGL